MIEVAVLGEALWDVFPAVARESLRTRRREERHPGGAPANVARVLGRLGISTAFVGALGRDALGDGLLDALIEDDVDVSRVQRVRARTGLTFVDMLDDGRASFVPYREGGADFELEREAVVGLRARVLHLGSSSFSRAPVRDAALAAIDEVRAGGGSVSFDCNLYRHLWRESFAVLDPLIESVELFKASEDDLRVLGLAPDALHARRSGLRTIVTMGARGAIAFDGARKLEIPSHAERVVDATGAGDAFTAGVLSLLVRGGSFDEALQLGAELAGRAVTEVGATTALLRLEPRS